MVQSWHTGTWNFRGYMVDIQRYIQIPYKEHGRDHDGCDCLGLVILVYREEFGLNFPDVLYSDPQDPDNAGLINVMKSTVEAMPVDDPQEGDIVLLILSGAPHMGVYVGKGAMLHTSCRFGTVCERLSRYRGRSMVYYRVNC